MNTIITTANALKELAAGVTLDRVDTSKRLHSQTIGSNHHVLSLDFPKTAGTVLIETNPAFREGIVPPELRRYRSELLSRMAAFAERAQTFPLSLPKSWGQYKTNNLIAFSAIPVALEPHWRWITEIVSHEDSVEVYFRLLEDGRGKSTLDDFAAANPKRKYIDHAESASASANLALELDKLSRASLVDVDMSLDALNVDASFPRTFEGWLGTVSPDQLAFIEAPTDKSIRLRGPAGSGKTLALTLKCMREARRLSEAGQNRKVAFVTHSWSLATQVQATIEALGALPSTQIDVFPLLAIAESLVPREYLDSAGTALVGDDNLSGKQAQLDEILEVLLDFQKGDWLTYRSQASPDIRNRFDTSDDTKLLALAWDLLIEFGSVIGAAGIFPGAGSASRFMELKRSPWMLKLDTPGDRKIIFELYSRYVKSLEERGLVTTDQLLSDFVSYLESHAWNRKRKLVGYDLVFVDEFHLFNPLERQVLHYLNRDVETYPRLFMAADPRQSPSGALIGEASDEITSFAVTDDGEDRTINSFDLKEVHRFTPQILELVKHVHTAFPTLFFGEEWDIDFSQVKSTAAEGNIPIAVNSGGRDAEMVDIFKAVEELYPKGTVGIAVVDNRHWRRFSSIASELQQRGGRYHVSVVTGRSDLEAAGYRSRGLVIGTSENLAGLQYDSVIVTGIPDMRAGVISPADRNRVLSMIYLAMSRAMTEVRVFTNSEDGGLPEVLLTAAQSQIIETRSGREL